eukprot:COSAG06_NODE_7511_length_2479_cov_8.699580_2_plen_113_part_00
MLLLFSSRSLALSTEALLLHSMGENQELAGPLCDLVIMAAQHSDDGTVGDAGGGAGEARGEGGAAEATLYDDIDEEQLDLAHRVRRMQAAQSDTVVVGGIAPAAAAVVTAVV